MVPAVFMVNGEVVFKKVIPAVPREGDEVVINFTTYKATKLSWKFTDGRNLRDQDNVTITLEKV